MTCSIGACQHQLSTTIIACVVAVAAKYSASEGVQLQVIATGGDPSALTWCFCWWPVTGDREPCGT
jgi:hypothetical protein